MLKKLLFALLFISGVSAFGVNVTAQIDETFPVRKSALAEIALPSGALKVREASVPAEINETLQKLVAEGGSKVRQGGSEVIMWTGGNYKKAAAGQLTKKIETALQTSGWTYEIGERQSEFVLFTLFRETPQRRALVGFFVPSDDIYIFAVTEMLAANALVTDSEKRVFEEPANNKNGGSLNSRNDDSASIVGKWSRSAGGGFIDYTGKTKHKSGKSFSFEFFPDGTVEYIYDMDVLSIVQCRTTELTKARGRYAISGDSLTINLAAGSSIGSSSCEAKDNFKRAVPASTVTKKFTIKRMDSITRPDNPWMLCFDGSGEETCFERTNE